VRPKCEHRAAEKQITGILTGQMLIIIVFYNAVRSVIHRLILILLILLILFTLFVVILSYFKTRSIRTVHISAKVRLTSVAIRILICIRIHIQAPNPDRHQNLTVCSLAHCYFQALAEDIFICADYALSALETILSCLMGYISVLSNSNSNSNRP